MKMFHFFARNYCKNKAHFEFLDGVVQPPPLRLKGPLVLLVDLDPGRLLGVGLGQVGRLLLLGRQQQLGGLQLGLDAGGG